MQKIFVMFVLCLVLLTACGSKKITTVECSPVFDGTIGTCLPDGWQKIDSSVLKARGIPGEIVGSFQSRTPVPGGIYPTVTVAREFLAEAYEPSRYSVESVEAVKSTAGYQEIDQRSVTIDNAKVKIHVFYAQPRSDSPRYRFYQLSTVSNNIGYTFTVAVPLSVTDQLEKEILTILEHATLKKSV